MNRTVKGVFKNYNDEEFSSAWRVGQKLDGSKILEMKYFDPADVAFGHFVDVIKEDGTVNRIMNPDEVYFEAVEENLNYNYDVFSEFDEVNIDKEIEAIVEERLPEMLEKLFRRDFDKIIDKIIRKIFRGEQ